MHDMDRETICNDAADWRARKACEITKFQSRKIHRAHYSYTLLRLKQSTLTSSTSWMYSVDFHSKICFETKDGEAKSVVAFTPTFGLHAVVVMLD